MLEEVWPQLYRIEIPLPGTPLKSLNSYLIKGEKRSLLIDTGLDREECQRSMLNALAKLGVELDQTDFFITHLHLDHIGLMPSLARESSRVYFNPKEAAMFNSERRWAEIYDVYLANGFPEDELKKSFQGLPGFRYPPKHFDFYLLDEGDVIEVGDYRLHCLKTPGHSPGHSCLYEPKKKLLFSGDHLLFDITPAVSFWLEMENPLKEYLASLDKLYPLEISLVLPGHRRLFTDHRERINQIKVHHQARNDEIISALRDGEKTAFEVAPQVSWDVDDTWDLMPALQKWFAFGETIAHLRYLEEEAVVERKRRGDKIVFSLR